MGSNLIQYLGGVFGWHWCKHFNEYIWSFLCWPVKETPRTDSQIKAKNLILSLFKEKPKWIFTGRRRIATYYWWRLLLCLLFILFLVTKEVVNNGSSVNV